uniref:Tyrosine-protein phosphatase domain-containing protein n=2 Tax=Caenorhabditis japonica TaxID=281687 RepID=A0A8R1ITS3_CAEJA
MERDCQMWKKNFTKNQSDTFPILDATLVKIQNAPDDYVNLSSIKVPHVIHPVLMGQIPKKGCEEDFWKATFQENVVVVYVLVSGGETDKVQFFPNEAGGFIYHGNMFVNIRKVDKMDDERTRFTIEILPNGMSNSNILDVYVHTGWEPFAVPVKYANTTRSVVDMMNFVKSSNGTEKLMILSQNGSGRAGFFVSLGAAFCCLNDLLEPNIVEIVKTIRLQRPHSVASLKQYASLYLCLIYYIKKKCIIPEALKAKLEDVTKALETVIREDLSIMF